MIVHVLAACLEALGKAKPAAECYQQSQRLFEADMQQC
jgi:hypothetical protein